MRRILKIEYERSTHNLGMLLALLMGIGCILYQVIPVILRIIESKDIYKNIYTSFTRGGFYNLWLPGYLDGSTIYYFYFIGIIVALPFGISYVRDKNSGYIKNICNRVEKKKYLKAKFISTFISGGCTAVIPLIIDFLIVRLIIPIDCFEDIKGTVLNGITDWNAFIIQHSYIAFVIILLMWFCFGGALATISLMASAFSSNYFTIQLSPFFFMMILFYLPSFLPDSYGKYFPYNFLSLFGKGNPFICFVEITLILVVTYVAFVIGETRKDIL